MLAARITDLFLEVTCHQNNGSQIFSFLDQRHLILPKKPVDNDDVDDFIVSVHHLEANSLIV